MGIENFLNESKVVKIILLTLDAHSFDALKLENLQVDIDVIDGLRQKNSNLRSTSTEIKYRRISRTHRYILKVETNLASNKARQP